MAKIINYYIAIYIDILGQKSKLEQIKSLPNNEEEKEEFLILFEETAGKVEHLHSDFEGILKGLKQKTKMDLSKFSDDQKQMFDKARELHWETLKFSDTIILYCTLNKEINNMPFKSIYFALFSTANTMILSLAHHQTPLRGAISIGIGTKLEESGLYGPILNELHHMESELADYPRILISNEIIEMIRMGEKDLEYKSDYFSMIEKGMIKDTKNLIKQDTDGYYILDYMSQPVEEAWGKEVKKEHYKMIVNFIECEKKKFTKNQKLLERYRKLSHYIRKHKSNWIF